MPSDGLYVEAASGHYPQLAQHGVSLPFLSKEDCLRASFLADEQQVESVENEILRLLFPPTPMDPLAQRMLRTPPSMRTHQMSDRPADLIPQHTWPRNAEPVLCRATGSAHSWRDRTS